jgi:hypothetical protein
MPVSDHRLGDYDLGTGDRLPFLRPDKIKRLSKLCKDVRGDLWEFISYPYIEEGRVCIKICVPGDPTSIITADAMLLDPEGKPCLCTEAGKDFYLDPKYYRECAARLKECPAYLKGGPAE